MKLKRIYKTLVIVSMDILSILVAYIAGLIFSTQVAELSENSIQRYMFYILVVILIQLVILSLFKLYSSFWHMAGVHEFIKGFIGCVTGWLLTLIPYFLLNLDQSFKTILLGGIFTLVLVLGFRCFLRIYRRIIKAYNLNTKVNMQRTLIIGAGAGGVLLLRELNKSDKTDFKPVAFIDDDPMKLGKYIYGLRVEGTRNDMIKVIEGKKIDVVIVAIPSLGGLVKKQIIEYCQKNGVKIKMMPSIDEIISDRFSINQVRDVDVKDLLGREPVKLDHEEIEEYLTNKCVLVTGGGGSIGSELCRQIARFKPKNLIILDIYENNAYDIQNELKGLYPDLDLKVLIASVRDKRRLDKIFNAYSPEVVFHAAAHKHVPLMEDSPAEAIKNNVMGTLNTAEIADKYKVEKFILISTDKAVNPTNIMGASKRMCEMIIQAINLKSNTEFAAVRFGNVLGSNGSVIPLFKRQIKHGGPVTVTHEEITRYFMLIPEAAQLVLQAAAYANGGEIFVLNMGSPVKIYDLACQLIRLSGLEPHKDIEVKVTGLRPGEKLYEELLMDEEGLKETKHKKIFIGRPSRFDLDTLKGQIEYLLHIAEHEESMIFDKVEELVPTYIRKNTELVAVTVE
ncbi:nucleoside-diphosphate sugar epimerase/dehydratase [Vallitalea okinawensis]|uniref:nucleoside-diphosphate sugar epimerase/dehydratase n=1 Tax=Vallitalea okinawensis TaxID=2078660 RepID=UPI000CFC078B|nr:nucleoside-diphosphate sugar epimerase/dehydratase [Vallitalea okinawensis]